MNESHLDDQTVEILFQRRVYKIMPGWLTRASDAISRRRPSPAPEPFEIICSCGGPIQGLRRLREQRILCRNCGEAFFILPQDVYPQAKLPKRKRSRRLKASKSSARSELVGAAASTASTEKPTQDGRQQTTSEFGSRQAVRGIDIAKLSGRPAERLKHLRLVIVFMVIVTALTVFWVMRSRAVDRAVLTYRDSVDRGRAALADGDFTQAAEAFGSAREALELLGNQAGDASEIEQLWRESTAADKLTTATIFEIVSEGRDYVENGRGQDWDVHFAAAYKNSWVIMEASVSRLIGGDGKQRFQLDYPMAVGGTPIVFEADLSTFRSLSFDNEPQPVIFAAQLANCRLAGGDGARWVVSLRDRTDDEQTPPAFLWSNLKTYRQLGFIGDDAEATSATAELLERQSQYLDAAK